MKTIKLTQGQSTIVDDSDYDMLMDFKWSADNDGYHFYAKTKRNYTILCMHRLVANASKGQIVDHVNGDTLDNRKCNLRIVSHQSNMRNMVRRKKSSSGYKGVSWQKSTGKWQAGIRINKIQKYLGCFTSKIQAASAYDSAAVKHFGEYASFNFPVSLLAVASKKRVCHYGILE